MTIFSMITTQASAPFTEHALHSFFQCTRLKDEDKFYLIDNDGTYETAEFFKRVEIIKNRSPLGFAQNANEIIKHALLDRTHVVLMNNDIILSPHWLDYCAVNDRAIISPLSNREQTYDLPTVRTPLVMQLEDYLRQKDQITQLFEAHRRSMSGLYNDIGLPFFCVRIPYPVLDELGYLDERFGRGGAEDYDYCLRAHLAGFGVAYALSSFILHFGGKSSYDGAETKGQQIERELKFRREFEMKWGSDLLKMVVLEDPSYWAEGMPARMLATQGKYKEIIETFKLPQPVAVHLPRGSDLALDVPTFS